MWLVELPGSTVHCSSAGAAQSCLATGIRVVFTQVSPQGTGSRVLRAFATLPSTVCVPSGVPVITERSCSSILCQVTITEVSLPTTVRLLHHPCASAIPTIHQCFAFVQGSWAFTGLGGVKTRRQQLGWLLDTKRFPKRAGRFSGDW